MPRTKKIIPEPEVKPEIRTVDFDKFAGLKASLYYNNHLNRFQLGDVEFEVIEDECDGYRSSMREVQIIRTDAPRNSGDFLEIVTIEKVFEGNMDGYHLVAPDGHVWLEFGTDNYDDYYPTFKFYFNAKKGTEKPLEQAIQ